jgi:hypothetical protein
MNADTGKVMVMKFPVDKDVGLNNLFNVAQEDDLHYVFQATYCM